MTPHHDMTPDNMNAPAHINPIEWNQALGNARQVCARIFAEGGGPADALSAFGLKDGDRPTDWSRAVAQIAETMCAVGSVRNAA